MTEAAFNIAQSRLVLLRGDITQQDANAIVNAANPGLLGGGGVDGAIHRAAGPELLEQCKQVRALSGQCAFGDAVITGGGKLKARHVIHAVGPIWRGGHSNESFVLSSAYKKCLELAMEEGVKTIAFPSISTGAYGYPVDLAAPVAIETVASFILDNPDSLEEVRFVLFDDRTFEAYKKACEEQLR